MGWFYYPVQKQTQSIYPPQISENIELAQAQNSLQKPNILLN